MQYDVMTVKCCKYL